MHPQLTGGHDRGGTRQGRHVSHARTKMSIDDTRGLGERMSSDTGSIPMAPSHDVFLAGTQRRSLRRISLFLRLEPVSER